MIIDHSRDLFSKQVYPHSTQLRGVAKRMATECLRGGAKTERYHNPLETQKKETQLQTKRANAEGAYGQNACRLALGVKIQQGIDELLKGSLVWFQS